MLDDSERANGPRPRDGAPRPAGPARRRAWFGWSDAAVRGASMDRLLFGDNQFFGINHMSEEKARAQAMQFQDLAAIIEVLDAAYDEGIRTFMCTTHDRVGGDLRPRAGEPVALRRASSSTPACPTRTNTPTR